MRSGKLTIATGQHAVWGDINPNLAAIIKLVRLAKSKGADIAHFSECNLTGYPGLDFKQINSGEKPEIENALGKLRELSGSLNTWLIIGGHHFVDQRKQYLQERKLFPVVYGSAGRTDTGQTGQKSPQGSDQ